MRIKKIMLFHFFVIFIITIFFSSCSPVRDKEKIKVSWIDSDGSVIETMYLDGKDDFEKRELPADTEKWHYTDWKIVYSSDVIICVAQRVEKIKYVWKNFDGSIMQEQTEFDETALIYPEIPNSTDKWEYLGWDKSFDESTCIFTLQRTPQEEYFSGNIFQIVLNDKSGKPISTGSGFIINQDGWFITNNHVMDGGFSANAYFDIRNNDTNQDYYELSIKGGVYNSEELDIFIGKLDGYEKLTNYYQDITFSVNYELGETTYSVGYPNSSLFMQINQGELIEEYKDIYSKIYDRYYLLSDSYIAPGSSGGILINEKFEVLGITTIGLYADSNQTIYLAGGAVPTSLFLDKTQELNEVDLKLLNEIYIN